MNCLEIILFQWKMKIANNCVSLPLCVVCFDSNNKSLSVFFGKEFKNGLDISNRYKVKISEPYFDNFRVLLNKYNHIFLVCSVKNFFNYF